MINTQHAQLKRSLGVLSFGLILGLIVQPTPAVSQDMAQMDRLVFDVFLIPEDEEEVLTTSPDLSSSELAQTLADNNSASILEEFSQRQDNIDQYLQSISDEVLANGPFAPALLQQYLSIGELYQQINQHDEAITAFEDAEYISRINNGLRSSEQFVIVKNMIDSYIALGDFGTANEKQRYLLYLNQQFYGQNDQGIIPALLTLGDWNMNTFETAMRADNSIGLTFNSQDPVFSNRSPTPRALAFGNLYQARSIYYQAILNLIANKNVFGTDILALEQKLIETIFLGAYRREIIEEPNFYMDIKASSTGSLIRKSRNLSSTPNFIDGRNSFARQLIYQTGRKESGPVDIAQSMIGMGDWHMLFNRTLKGIEYYEEAYLYLVNNGVDEELINDLLNPSIPQQLPEFTSQPHSRQKLSISPSTQLEYEGFIDISFTISRFGNARRLRVINSSENVPNIVTNRLKRILRSAPFRPRFSDDELTRNNTVALRYYFSFN